jgi:hypothetical protein
VGVGVVVSQVGLACILNGVGQGGYGLGGLHCMIEVIDACA